MYYTIKIFIKKSIFILTSVMIILIIILLIILTGGESMSAIANKPITQMIYEKVYTDIVNGVYKTDSIITERELIKCYSVSKSPIREALITLCDERILQSIPRAGYRVVGFRLDQVRQIMEARSAIELYLFEKSFPSIGETEIQLLEDAENNCMEYDADKDTPAVLWGKNVRFHLLLASFAKNEYMQGLLNDALRLNARASAMYFEYEKKSDRVSVHKLFIEALKNKDLEKAKQLLLEDAKSMYTWEVMQL